MKEAVKKIFNKWFLVMLLATNILFTAFFAAKNTIINSDFMSSILLLNELFASRVFFASDPFVLHYPLFYLILHIFGYTLTSTFLIICISIVLTLGAYSFFYLYFVRKYIVKPSVIYFLPLFFFINISWAFYYHIAHTSGRNIEFGIALLITLYFDNVKSLSKNIFLTILVYISLLGILLSDAYFYYLFTLPLLLILASKIHRAKEYLKATLYLLVTMIATSLILTFLNMTPYVTLYTESLHVATGIRLLYNFGMIVTSLTWYLSTIHVLFSVLEFLAFIAGGYGLYLLFKIYYKKDVVIPILIPLCFIFTLAAYLLSTKPTDIGTSRYLVFLFFLLPVGVCFFLSKITQPFLRAGFCVCLVAICLVNGIYFTRIFYQLGNANAYQPNRALIKMAHTYELEYGYTSYWHAGVNTFLSGDTIRFRQVICDNHRIQPYRFWSSQRWYEDDGTNKKTFLLIDLQENLTPHLVGCNLQDITRQFGAPKKTIPISVAQGTLTFLIFDYNIAQRFD